MRLCHRSFRDCGIGKGIEDYDSVIRMPLAPVAYKIRADKTGPACDQKISHFSSFRNSFGLSDAPFGKRALAGVPHFSERGIDRRPPTSRYRRNKLNAPDQTYEDGFIKRKLLISQIGIEYAP